MVHMVTISCAEKNSVAATAYNICSTPSTRHTSCTTPQPCAVDRGMRRTCSRRYAWKSVVRNESSHHGKEASGQQKQRTFILRFCNRSITFSTRICSKISRTKKEENQAYPASWDGFSSDLCHRVRPPETLTPKMLSQTTTRSAYQLAQHGALLLDHQTNVHNHCPHTFRLRTVNIVLYTGHRFLERQHVTSNRALLTSLTFADATLAPLQTDVIGRKCQLVTSYKNCLSHHRLKNKVFLLALRPDIISAMSSTVGRKAISRGKPQPTQNCESVGYL